MFVDELIATIGQGLGPEAKHIWFMTWHQFCLFRQNTSQEPNYYYLDICRVDHVSNHSIGRVVELCSSVILAQSFRMAENTVNNPDTREMGPGGTS